jgi:VanZ family protein
MNRALDARGRRGRLAWILAFYVVFLAVVVTIADTGRYRAAFDAIHAVPWGDKVGHFGFMAILSFLVQLVWPDATLRAGRLALPRGPAIVALITTLEKLSQGFFPTRTLDPLDLTANLVGITFGALLARTVSRRRGLAAPASSA